ncbi:MAG: 2-C-methyl-D-erythritol 2,4-cyclodiphosphate synthase [Caldisericia bacterium]|nr:2-C-methyl-D-erythritol 2,4-cyclodiphosphate synthase [Caldisericia bacterium]
MKAKLKKCSCIIVGSGKGTRYSSLESKLFANLSGKPVIVRSVSNFLENPNFEEIILVGPFEMSFFCDYFGEAKKIKIVKGGDTRAKSVSNGLLACNDSSEFVFVHDAARPYVSSRTIDHLLDLLSEDIDGVIPVLPIYDSLKKIDANSIQSSISMKNIVRAQTPQAFKKKKLIRAYNAIGTEQSLAKDDAELLMMYDNDSCIKYVKGEYASEKITDIETFKMLEKITKSSFKTGLGWDFHPFKKDRKLILGGCLFENTIGLEGDSDGDVVCHSIIDSLLGALGKGDIGSFFGVKTPNMMGVESLKLLEILRGTSLGFYWEIVNIDITVICKIPNIMEHSERMKTKISNALRIEKKCVNIKATTDKGMDAAGEGKGIRSIAISQIKIEEE